jgi:sugar-specific transcriptional regulator TrmB
LEERLKELNDEFKEALQHVASLKKEGSQPSPGLVTSIVTLRNKLENFIDSVELWRTIKKVYPNYDR